MIVRLSVRMAVAAVVCASRCSAQDAGVIGPVAIGFGVDTTRAPTRDIVVRWSAYLLSEPEKPRASPLWVQSEQDRWPDFDLTGRWLYQGFSPTIVEVARMGSGDSLFVVKTLFARAKDGAIQPIGLQQTYAVRTSDGWRFANALPRVTASWRRRTVGPIRYRVEPGASFDAARAGRAAAFVSRLARRFALPTSGPIDYVVAKSPDSMARAIGLEWTIPGTAGRAYPENRLVLSGSPAYGEAYLHELVHIVAAPLATSTAPYWLTSEGLATWLGGSQGKTTDTLFGELAAYQTSHPSLRLQDIFDETDEAAPVLYSSAALLFALVGERGGDSSVRALYAAGTTLDGFRAEVRQSLGVTDAKLEALWRSAPTRMARGGRSRRMRRS